MRVLRFLSSKIYSFRVSMARIQLPITKRQEFVLLSMLLTVGLIGIQVLPEYRYVLSFGLAAVAYVGAAFALRSDLRGVEYLSLLALPTLFTLSVALFYFLLPARWISRIPVAVLYVLGMYALLLTENIYNVAANRTIALLRAAHTVGFVITLVTYYLLIQTVLAFRLHAVVTLILGLPITFVLILQILWSIELTPVMSARVRRVGAILALIFAELLWILSFWSVKTTMKALLLTTVFYSLVGLAQQFLVEKMYKKTIIEFSLVAIGIVVLLFLTTNWRGVF